MAAGKVVDEKPAKKKSKDPNAPKKPLSPFMIFMKKRRIEYKQQNQGKSMPAGWM